ncbi:MAG TPA: phosphodiester glycosidase family protein [Patescibacteria group bacterium]|nr:phosphodiester glycosidase family protein [Patescibacteria group bacterium]
MKIKLPNLKKYRIILFSLIAIFVLSIFSYSAYFLYSRSKVDNETAVSLEDKLRQVESELNNLKNEDQYKINQELKKEIDDINKTYKKAVSSYESLLDLKVKSKDTSLEDKLFAQALSLLSEKKYQEAEEVIVKLNKKIEEQFTKLAESEVKTSVGFSAPASNNPPGSGYSQQKVSTDAGEFLVNIIAADINSTRVIVDTASNGDCLDNCPVLPLATYVSRNGAYAGVNGSYFCPASYPSCAGKTNTFDTLLMNKDKVYFNSSNNVYSANPGVIFGGSYVRFVSAVSQWGRDTSIDSMISNYPLLIMGGNIAFGGDDDPKKGSKGNRSFVANKGSSIYIGVVMNATVAESSRVMKALGMENALNLDDGGSTALWSGGYKLGPGRDLPNAIIFVNK